MVIDTTRPMTVTEFDEWVQRPENADRLFEFIAGEIVEVPSNPFASEIAILISAAILAFVRKHKLGHVTGEAGGYQINGERHAPDVAFISYKRQRKLVKKGYNPNPPELAVEIISDPKNSQEQEELRRKLNNYLADNVVVWIVNPEKRTVEVYENDQPVTVVDEQGRLDGGAVLPGFVLPVADLFVEDSDES